MATAARTYWLTTACRIARKDQSLLIERAGGTPVHIPVTDVRDIVACAPAEPEHRSHQPAQHQPHQRPLPHSLR
jgi:hypothetical protein